MKKIAIIIVVIILTVVLFMGCGEILNNNNAEIENENETENETEIETTEGPKVEEESQPESDPLTDTGAFQGQIDSNSVEIKISGVPNENALRVFMLSEEAKISLNQLNLDIGVDIKFEYYKNDNDQDVIESIEIIGSDSN